MIIISSVLPLGNQHLKLIIPTTNVSSSSFWKDVRKNSASEIKSHTHTHTGRESSIREWCHRHRLHRNPVSIETVAKETARVVPKRFVFASRRSRRRWQTRRQKVSSRAPSVGGRVKVVNWKPPGTLMSRSSARQYEALFHTSTSSGDVVVVVVVVKICW